MKACLIFLMSLSAMAETPQLCPPVKPTGEGHWPIPEAEFTKERAEAASQELMDALKRIDGEHMAPRHVGGLDVGPYVLNRLTYIKGFALRSEVLEAISLGDVEMTRWSTGVFCKFLQEEAQVWH
jgi:hypothetical protein